MTTQEDKLQRIRQAGKLMLHASYQDVVEVLMGLYSVSERTAKSYIKESRSLCRLSQDFWEDDAFDDYQLMRSIAFSALKDANLPLVMKAIMNARTLRQDVRNDDAARIQRQWLDPGPVPDVVLDYVQETEKRLKVTNPELFPDDEANSED